jgi:Fe-S-cluster containining protein
MRLDEKVKAVAEVFTKLDAEIVAFQQNTNLHCKLGCGKCCFKPDIEATPLEFLPFAFDLYQKDLAFVWFEKLKQADTSICLILNPTQSGAGLCSEYAHRGLICRLFGYSARTNKYNQKEYVTCQIIKTEQKENYDRAAEKVSAGGEIPIMNQFYMQLHAIDMDLTHNFYPINEAIRRAIEYVLSYYAYREE